MKKSFAAPTMALLAWLPLFTGDATARYPDLPIQAFMTGLQKVGVAH